jgi:hypothetical protein
LIFGDPEQRMGGMRFVRVQKNAVTLMKVLIVLILSHHMLVTAFYLSPKNPIKTKLNSYLQKYMGPLFYQNWHLFSPNPGTKFIRLQALCKNEISSNWIQPMGNIEKSHQLTRILGSGKVLYYYREIGEDLWNQTTSRFHECSKNKIGTQGTVIEECQRQAIENSQGAFELKRAVLYGKKSCEILKNNSKLSALKIIRFEPVQYSKRKEQFLTNHSSYFVFEFEKER